MLVTIVTPYYNGEEHILETINSIRAQTIEDWEYLIVDDGSKEISNQRLNEIVGDDKKIRILRKENGGQSLARNYGFNEGDKSSKFVIFLDHDDVLEPNALEILINKLNSNPQYAAAHGLARFFGGDPMALGVATVDDIEAWGRTRSYVKDGQVISLSLNEPTTFAALAHKAWISTPGQILFRRSVFEQSGMYNHIYAPVDDWEMCLRISQFGPIGFVDAVVLNWRRHETSMSTGLNDRWVELNSHVQYNYMKNEQFSQENRDAMVSAYEYFLNEWYRSKIDLGLNAMSKGHVINGLKEFGYGLKPFRKLVSFKVKRLAF